MIVYRGSFFFFSFNEKILRQSFFFFFKNRRLLYGTMSTSNMCSFCSEKRVVVNQKHLTKTHRIQAKRQKICKQGVPQLFFPLFCLLFFSKKKKKFMEKKMWIFEFFIFAYENVGKKINRWKKYNFFVWKKKKKLWKKTKNRIFEFFIFAYENVGKKNPMVGVGLKSSFFLFLKKIEL